ncbi:MAG: magnesium transporter [Candidatus Omnitrophota bacterium]
MKIAKNSRKLKNIFSLFLPEIKELLKEKNFSELKDLLKRTHSMDLAEGWPLLSEQEKILIFKLLSQRKAIEVFEDLSFEEQEYLLNNLDNAEIASLLNEMASDERVELFKDLSNKTVKKLFTLMKKEEVDDVRKLLTFEEDTAGSLMTTEFVELKKEMTCRRAILYLQEKQKSNQGERIYSIYVTDEEHKLIGGLSLQALVISPPDMLIRDAMSDVELVKVYVNMPEEEVAQHFSKYDLLDSPVTNEQNQLVGIITVDDVVDLMSREATKEVYEIGKMSGRGGEEIRYASTSIRELVRRRAPWLMFLLVFDFLTGTVLKTFEHALGTVVALTFFIPMLLDTGGNAGNQAAITIIRGMATGDVSFKNIWRVAKLEIFTAFLMGIIVGIVAFIRAMLLQGELMLALVVGSTMAIIILLAILTGVFLPFISKRFGLDPAVLAGPITTSFIDVVGLIIYFKIAQFLIPALR